MATIARMSMNLITLGKRSLDEMLPACAEHGIGTVALWRNHLEETGLARTRELLEHHGLAVSSLCRGGFFPAASADERARRIDENRTAIDEIAGVGGDLLVLVCGAAEGQPLADARAQIREGIAAIAPYARERGVRLGVEPLHPMLCDARSAIATLDEAVDVVEDVGAVNVGVIVDVYHVWWDPYLARAIARAGEHILGFHVSDWITPNGDVLAQRAMMGDGCIDIAGIRGLVEAAGYAGPIEVEVINPAIAARPLPELLGTIAQRFEAV
jgi:sugar phosphate isomerase/epimerase